MYHTSAEPVKGGGNLDLPAFGSLRDFDAEEALVPHGERCAARRAGEQRGCNRTTCGILSGSLGQTPQVFENPGGGGPSAAIRTVTTDNGCEFPVQQRLDRALGAEVYYTGPTPPTRRDRSRTATASSGGGTPRAPTSAARRGARSGTSRTGSTPFTGNHSTEKPRMLTIHVLPRRIREFLPTHDPCKLPKGASAAPLSRSLL